MSKRSTVVALAILSSLGLASGAWAQQKSRAEVKADAAANKASGPTGEIMPAPEAASAPKPAKPRVKKSGNATKPQGEANQDKPKP